MPVILMAVATFFFLGVVAWFTHVERMECMERGGTMVEHNCQLPTPTQQGD